MPSDLHPMKVQGPIVAILAGFSIVFALTSGLTLKYFNFQNR